MILEESGIRADFLVTLSAAQGLDNDPKLLRCASIK
jgi:hypothetical protein